MALIKCPECGKEISSSAEKCIGCGYPITAPAQQRGSSVQTIQQTSKDLKLWVLISAGVILVGMIILWGAGEPIGGYLMLGGIILLVSTKMKIWWEHE